MSKLTKSQIEDVLLKVAPSVRRSRVYKQRVVLFGIAAHLPCVMLNHRINTPLRAAHFIAQLAHESDGFCTVEEYASGRAYEGRKDLGNTERGDGERFKGRGPIQCTGRHNYMYFGEKMGVNLIDDPTLLLRPAYGCLMSALYWNDRNLSALADQDNIHAITKKINGGYNGLADRKRYFDIAARVLNLKEASLLLKRRSKGDAVEKLQHRLKELGYHVGLIDGDFGAQTERALRLYQRDLKLHVDGQALVGGPTWQTLFEHSGG